MPSNQTVDEEGLSIESLTDGRVGIAVAPPIERNDAMTIYPAELQVPDLRAPLATEFNGYAGGGARYARRTWFEKHRNDRIRPEGGGRKTPSIAERESNRVESAPSDSPGRVAQEVRELRPSTSELGGGAVDEVADEIVERAVAAGHVDPRLTKALADVALSLVKIDALQAQAARSVARARELGASWAEVGRATGVTAPAAFRRWDAKAKERARASRQDLRRRRIDG